MTQEPQVITIRLDFRCLLNFGVQYPDSTELENGTDTSKSLFTRITCIVLL